MFLKIFNNHRSSIVYNRLKRVVNFKIEGAMKIYFHFPIVTPMNLA